MIVLIGQSASIGRPSGSGGAPPFNWLPEGGVLRQELAGLGQRGQRPEAAMHSILSDLIIALGGVPPEMPLGQ